MVLDVLSRPNSLLVLSCSRYLLFIPDSALQSFNFVESTLSSRQYQTSLRQVDRQVFYAVARSSAQILSTCRKFVLVTCMIHFPLDYQVIAPRGPEVVMSWQVSTWPPQHLWSYGIKEPESSLSCFIVDTGFASCIWITAARSKQIKHDNGIFEDQWLSQTSEYFTATWRTPEAELKAWRPRAVGINCG